MDAQSIGNVFVGTGRGRNHLAAPISLGKEKKCSERSGCYYNNCLSKMVGFIESKDHQDRVRLKHLTNDVFLIFDLNSLVTVDLVIFCSDWGDKRALIHYVQLQFADHLKQLLHTVIDSERYEVLKSYSVKNAETFACQTNFLD